MAKKVQMCTDAFTMWRVYMRISHFGGITPACSGASTEQKPDFDTNGVNGRFQVITYSYLNKYINYIKLLAYMFKIV
jgi:hypothetical protein